MEISDRSVGIELEEDMVGMGESGAAGIEKVNREHRAFVLFCFFFFFSSRRRHTRFLPVSWARTKTKIANIGLSGTHLAFINAN